MREKLGKERKNKGIMRFKKEREIRESQERNKKKVLKFFLKKKISKEKKKN